MRDLIIIGGGPSGIGAALQADTLGLDPLLVEQGRLGGRLVHARNVRNFPLFLGTGSAAARRLAAQVLRRGIRVVHGSCRSVSTRGMALAVQCTDRDYLTGAAIIATGVRPKPLPWLPACVALEYWDSAAVGRGDGIAVIGGGETAFDQACSLAGRGADVSLLMRGQRPRAFALLVSEAIALGVRIYADAAVRRIERAGRHCLITLIDGRSLAVRHVVPAIGSRPYLPDLSTGAKRLFGKNLFISGDARSGNCRQAATAFSDGVAAAMQAYLHLNGQSE